MASAETHTGSHERVPPEVKGCQPATGSIRRVGSHLLRGELMAFAGPQARPGGRPMPLIGFAACLTRQVSVVAASGLVPGQLVVQELGETPAERPNPVLGRGRAHA